MTDNVDAGSPLVRIQDVHKRYGELEVLRGIDLTVGHGEVLVLIGASGSGKSTLLRCVNYLERIDSGFIMVDGQYAGYVAKDGRLREAREKQIAAYRAKIGMVFQHFNLFGHLTVTENVTIGPRKSLGMDREAAQEVAQQLLDRVGLRDKADAYPAQLSGGQQQRVAIARSLAMKPRLILFDEPTSSLDPELVGEVLAVMKDIATDGIAMMVVTHEMRFAESGADRIAFVDQGKIAALDVPAVLLHDPEHPRLRSFLAHLDA